MEQRPKLTPNRTTDIQLDPHGIAMKDVPVLSRTVLSIPYASEARSDEAVVSELPAIPRVRWLRP